MEKVKLINAVIKSLTKTVMTPFAHRNCNLSVTGRISVTLTVLFLIPIVGLWFSSPAVFAVEEICGSCGKKVSVTGNFTHRKDDASVTTQGAAGDAAAFREEINGKVFSVSVSNLPAGKYTILIGEVETLLSNPGERMFNVTSEDTVFATDFDIVETAGGAKKVCYITGVVEHQDDSLRGPLKVTFTAVKNNAKFNTFEVKDSSGASVVSFNASEIAEPFTGDVTRVPDIKETPIWRDPAQPLQKRVDDLIRRMSLSEKVAQLQNEAPAISRLAVCRFV